MDVAKSLLTKGVPVGDVALEVGYSSIPTFCRRFKEANGLTPKEFKKRNLG
jgi:AraC-like DNA-binding protein